MNSRADKLVICSCVPSGMAASPGMAHKRRLSDSVPDSELAKSPAALLSPSKVFSHAERVIQHNSKRPITES